MTVEGNASDRSAPPVADGGPPADQPPARRRRTTRAQVVRFAQAVRDSDQATVDDMIMRLSRARPWLAPLALAVGAFAMLFVGVKLLFTNWRLTLIQVLPAMWIWAAMFDLKAHVLHGKSFHCADRDGDRGSGRARRRRGHRGGLLPERGVRVRDRPARPGRRSGQAFTQARAHLPMVLGSGAVVGVLLGLSTVVVPRWGLFWFAVSLSIVVGIMMVCYVAVPARLIGMKTVVSRRDKLTATAVGGVVGAVICAPPYALGRVGLILLGSSTFFVLGVILFAVGLTLQAGATGAVKTVKMSAKLVSGRAPADPASE